MGRRLQCSDELAPLQPFLFTSAVCHRVCMWSSFIHGTFSSCSTAFRLGRKKYLTLRKGRYRDGGCTSNQPYNDEYDTCMCYN